MSLEVIEISSEMQSYKPNGDMVNFKLIKPKSKYVGQVYKTNSGERYRVLGQTNMINSQGVYYYFLIQFFDNTKIVVNGTNIRSGGIKNPCNPNVYGVGYYGQGKYFCKKNGKETKEYKLWSNMFRRCYDLEYHKTRPTYKNCLVSKSWHNYQNFCEDIKNLEGYENWKNNKTPHGYALDKDIKMPGNKIYSKDTCIFTTNANNSIAAHLTGRSYIARNIKTKEEIVFRNQLHFSKKYGLNQGCVNACLSKKQKTHKGWEFQII